MKTTCVCLAAVGVFFFARSAVADLWATPVPVSDINTGYHESAPFPTYDGKSLYFSRLGLSEAPTGRLYHATGPSSSGHFTSGEEVTGLNESGNSVAYPWVSPDNKRLYYYESSSTGRVIKMSRWSDSEGCWLAGTNVAGLSGLGSVANPSLTPDELTIVFTVTPGSLDTYDIRMGTRSDRESSFDTFWNLTEINNDKKGDFHPRLSSDGLTLYFASNRSGDSQLFEATRTGLDQPFETAHALLIHGSPVNGQYPAISADGRDLYFAQPVSGAGYDIFVSHVVPVPGATLLGLLGLSCAGWWCRRTAARSSHAAQRQL